MLENAIGKGEVESSILSGSTNKIAFIGRSAYSETARTISLMGAAIDFG
jgi:hypothetical protein